MKHMIWVYDFLRKSEVVLLFEQSLELQNQFSFNLLTCTVASTWPNMSSMTFLNRSFASSGRSSTLGTSPMNS